MFLAKLGGIFTTDIVRIVHAEGISLTLHPNYSVACTPRARAKTTIKSYDIVSRILLTQTDPIDSDGSYWLKSKNFGYERARNFVPSTHIISGGLRQKKRLGTKCVSRRDFRSITYSKSPNLIWYAQRKTPYMVQTYHLVSSTSFVCFTAVHNLCT